LNELLHVALHFASHAVSAAQQAEVQSLPTTAFSVFGASTAMTGEKAQRVWHTSSAVSK